MALDERTEQLIDNGLHDLLLMRLVREVVVANPAAGAEISQAVPGGIVWELLSVRMFLQASGVAGTRTPTVKVTDGDGNTVVRMSNSQSIAAGGSQEWSFLPGFGFQPASASANSCLPTPPLVMLPTWKVGTQTGNIDAGDQYSGVVITVRVWSESQVVLNATQIGKALESLTIDK